MKRLSPSARALKKLINTHGHGAVTRIAERLNVDPTTISKIYRGLRKPGRVLAQDLYACYSIDAMGWS